MSAQILTGHEMTTGRRKPSELVAEYEAKREGAARALEAWRAAQSTIVSAATIGGAYPGFTLDVGRLDDRDIERALLRSAWRHFYELYNLEQIASAKDKARIKRMFEQPPPFTLDSLRAEFGDYIADPRGSVLRGLAEVFGGLDPAFKSHERMKIGVKGLPKRVIISSVTAHGWGKDRVRDVLNALAAYQRKPLLTYRELCEIVERNGEALRFDGVLPAGRYEKEQPVVGRGVWLKTHANGNGHLYFDDATLRDVNRALAEYYGVVLPDCPEADERPARRAGTEVARDLQYYPTPRAVAESVVAEASIKPGMRVLEPSCGCGRILTALRDKGASTFGIEVDAGRAAQCRDAGFDVLTANFLDVPPSPEFDAVVMNPPFYGRHYEGHVRRALEWLKPGGRLTAILPATARYDHGGLTDIGPRWEDLPSGSFAESGTRIQTTVMTAFRKASIVAEAA